MGMALALPLMAWAQAVPQYEADPQWPVGTEQAAQQEYRRVDITGVATDAQGRVFVCAGTRNPVLVFDRDGRFLYSFGQRLFNEPHSVRIDPQGNVWLTDFATHLVTKFSPEGTLLAEYGTRDRRGRSSRHFNGPTDVAFGPNGDVYVADGYGNARVVRLSADGRYLGEWGRRGSRPGQFRLPHSIVADSQGRVYVADRENRRIQVFTAEGRFLSLWRLQDKPYGLSITGDGLMVVANGESNTISVLNLEGKLLSRWGRTGRQPGQFVEPHMLNVDDQDALYVAEATGKRVQKFHRR